MRREVFDAIMVVLAISTSIGFYLLYERLARKWLDVEDVPIPFPGPIRWTLAAAAFASTLVLMWICSLL
jgi:hypothetical protein